MIYKIFSALAALVGMIAAYWPSFNAPFEFDDIPRIIFNPVFALPQNIEAIWQYAPTRFFTNLTFALNFRLGGAEPLSYHIVNFILHLAAGILVYILAKIIFKMYVASDQRPATSDNSAAFFAAVIFLFHPIQTAAVTYTVQRATILAGICLLAALIFYCRWRQTGREKNYWLALLAGFAGAFCKPIIVALPGLILLTEFMFFSNRRPGPKDFKARVAFFFLLPVLVLILLHLEKFQIVDWQNIFAWNAETNKISHAEYLLTQFHVLWTYLRLLFLPLGQNIDYDYPITAGWDPLTAVCAFGLAGILVAALWLRKRNRLASFGIFWFFIALLPESSILPISDVIFEHRLYLPMLGFTLAIASVISCVFTYCSPGENFAGPAAGKAFAGHATRSGSSRSIFPRVTRSSLKNLSKFIFGSILFLLGVLTFNRNLLWSDRINFLRDVAAKSPNKARVHNSLAIAYAEEGAYGPALSALQRAIELDPQDVGGYNNRANIYRITGQIDLAIKEYSFIIDHFPGFAMAYYFRAQCWDAKGEKRKAAADAEMAARMGIR